MSPSARPLRALAASILLAAACAGGRGEPAREHGWESPKHRDHPLAGSIWDVRAGRFADFAALEQAAASADTLLLGEVHDNLDHHAVQARLVRAVASAGRRPVLAFEMLDDTQQAGVDAALARGATDADAIAEAVDWARHGWGPFSRYRPIFEAGLAAGMPIRAANLPRAVIAASISGGAGRLPEPVRARLERQGPLSEEARRAMRKEMLDSHCGALPDEALDPMVLAQRARDAVMAERLDAAGERGAILIAGTGHVRNDRGVPAYLDEGERTVVSVAMVEVVPGWEQPGEYAAAFDAPALPADFVVFTPAAEREDPCEAFRKHHPSPRPRPDADVRARTGAKGDAPPG